MIEELEQIKAAWSKDEAGGRDEALARELADEYVKENPVLFSSISQKSLEELCADVEAFRNANMEEEVWKIETWLLHRFEPQNIGGIYQPQVRVASEEVL